MSKFQDYDDDNNDFCNDEEKRIISTAFDSLICKKSCCRQGYIEDSFIESFCKKYIRKPPLINRGYFGRVECINQVTKNFLAYTENCARQVINLGAGLDTFSVNIISKNYSRLRFIELDFSSTISQKYNLLKTSKAFTLLSIPEQGISSVKTERGMDYNCGPNLSLLSANLCDINEVQLALDSANIDYSIPTLLLTECVLVYVEANKSISLFQYFSEKFNDAMWMTYDMLNPNDTFGKVMLQNLQTSGYRLPGFLSFPTILSQVNRFINNGWDVARCCTMLEAYHTIIPEERQRHAAQRELLDELEEWNLLMSHYSLTIAIKGNILTNLVNVIP